MSTHNWFERIPTWIWMSLLPIFGGAVHIYAGWKAKRKQWIVWGSGFIVSSLVLSYFYPPLLWLTISAQVVTAFTIKKRFLIATAPKGVTIPSAQVAGLLAEHKGQIDINRCTKDEMVYDLGLSIVYANDIELLRHEGYMFTDADDLSEVAGIPESIVRRIEPLIVFRYYEQQETELSWRRLNSYSVEQLIAYNIDREQAEKIVAERSNRGTYQSLLDVRKRTGIPLSVYRHLA